VSTRDTRPHADLGPQQDRHSVGTVDRDSFVDLPADSRREVVTAVRAVLDVDAASAVCVAVRRLDEMTESSQSR
jgi:hypothetical protein